MLTLPNFVLLQFKTHDLRFIVLQSKFKMLGSGCFIGLKYDQQGS